MMRYRELPAFLGSLLLMPSLACIYFTGCDSDSTVAGVGKLDP